MRYLKLFLIFVFCFSLTSCFSGKSDQSTETKEDSKTEVEESTSEVENSSSNENEENQTEVENITFTMSGYSIKYDGMPHSLYINEELPEGFKVTYLNNEQVEIGIYEVTAIVTGPNFETQTLVDTLQITTGEFRNIYLGTETFTYDGKAHSIYVKGELPPGTVVTYKNNKNVEVGFYTVTATLVNKNYRDLVLTGYVKIKEPDPQDQLIIWVGPKERDFYEKIANEWVQNYNKDKLPSDQFRAKIKVVGIEPNVAGEQFSTGYNNSPDIAAITGDSLGKVNGRYTKIGSFKDKKIIEQIKNQNSLGIFEACDNIHGNPYDKTYSIIPYTSQSLVYMYNKADFIGKEDKLTSWEGILEVAAEKNKYALTYFNEDNYYFSNFLLAQPANKAAIDVFGELGTLKLYEDGNVYNCYNYDDDQVAIMRYAQRLINNEHGRNGKVFSALGWKSEVHNNQTLGIIAGAYNYRDVTRVMGGKDKVGIIELPKFTLTKADEYGKAKAGMEFYSGSFTDFTGFVKSKESFHEKYLDDFIVKMTCDETQQRLFEECGIVPASKNVKVSNNPLVEAQAKGSKHGIPQPFGYNPLTSNHYYSQTTKEMFESMVESKDNDPLKILNQVQKICYMWVTGKQVESEEALSDWVWKRKPSFVESPVDIWEFIRKIDVPEHIYGDVWVLPTKVTVKDYTAEITWSVPEEYQDVVKITSDVPGELIVVVIDELEDTLYAQLRADLKWDCYGGWTKFQIYFMPESTKPNNN